jgi:dTDP-4-dehydrorhamnose 3,5-epimerase
VVFGITPMEGLGVMRFTATPLPGAHVVDIQPIEDERGMFARSWCPDEFRLHALDPRLAACNVSANRDAGTLRGMHYQIAPHEEAKLVRCTAGAIYDVIIDLRPHSATFCRWFGIELTARNHTALYVPPGFAHGFQTLEPESEVLYLISTPYVAESARGVRWNDPAFAVEWPPTARRVMSKRDETYPDFRPDSRPVV